MHKEIEQTLVNLNSANLEKKDRIKKVLRSYVDGEIELNEAYYELLDNDLISMPQRCGLFAKTNNTPEEEKNFKNYIKNKLMDQEL